MILNYNLMENDVLQRINDIIRFYKIKSDREFCRLISFNYDTYKAFFKRDSHPNVDFLTRLICTYTQINLDWLLTGKGEMLKQESVPLPDETPPQAVEPENSQQRTIETQARTIETQARIIETLTGK